MRIPHLILEITERCNFDCKQCFADSKEGERLKFKEIKRIIKESQGLNTKEIVLTGGEPLLHPKFKEIIKFISSQKINIGIRSNGSLIDKEMANFLSGFENIKWVCIALDGTKEVHESIKQVDGSFESACNAIELLSKEGMEVYPSITFLKENSDEVEDFIKLINDLGLEKFVFTRLFCTGRGTEEMSINLKEFREVIKELKGLGYSLDDLFESKFELNELSVFNRCSPCGLNIELDDYISYNGNHDLKSAQMDLVVVSRKGVFVIEVKNWSDEQVKNNEGLSPYEQVDRAGRVLYVFLESKFGKNPIASFFTGKGIDVSGKGTTDVLVSVQNNMSYDSNYKHVLVKSVSKLNDFITDREDVFKDSEVEKIVNTLRPYVTTK